MKSRKKYLVSTALAGLATILWFFHQPKSKRYEQPLPMTNGASQVFPTNSINTHLSLELLKDSRTSSIPEDILTRFRQGLITKDDAISEAYARRFSQPERFYGKIIDQNGKPVGGVEIKGSIEVPTEMGNGLQVETYQTRSDSEGLFEFSADKGGPFNVTVKKEGYLMALRGEGYQGPPGEKTTPYDRALLTMWKLRGAQPLRSFSISTAIPSDGTALTFDLETQKVNPEGDLRVTVNRSPAKVRRSGEGFDWTVKIEMPRGGLIEENDPYPYWAPENGYLPAFEQDMSSNSVSWYSHLTKSFYLKTPGGQYGLMLANVYTALTPARIKLDFLINPSGSQNLEINPDK